MDSILFVTQTELKDWEDGLAHLRPGAIQVAQALLGDPVELAHRGRTGAYAAPDPSKLALWILFPHLLLASSP